MDEESEKICPKCNIKLDYMDDGKYVCLGCWDVVNLQLFIYRLFFEMGRRKGLKEKENKD